MFCRARALFWGGNWRCPYWTWRSSLSPTTASVTSRELCVGGERLGITDLDPSISPAPSLYCMFLEAFTAACPSCQAWCKTGCAGNLVAVAQLCTLFLLWAETLQVKVRIMLVCGQAKALADEKSLFSDRTHSAFPSNTTLLNRYLKRTKR